MVLALTLPVSLMISDLY